MYGDRDQGTRQRWHVKKTLLDSVCADMDVLVCSLRTNTSRPWRNRATTMHRRSTTFGIYWLRISCRCLHAVWFYPGSTTATLCSTALHPAPPTSCSEYRTTPQGSFIKHQDDHTRNTAEEITLVAGGAAHLLQAGLADVQNTTDVSTGVRVPQSTHHSTRWNSVTEITGCFTAPCALQMDCHRQTIVQLCCTDNLKLSACFCH